MPSFFKRQTLCTMLKTIETHIEYLKIKVLGQHYNHWRQKMKTRITSRIPHIAIMLPDMINTQSLQWAKSMGVTAEEIGCSITTDTSGNVYNYLQKKTGGYPMKPIPPLFTNNNFYFRLVVCYRSNYMEKFWSRWRKRLALLEIWPDQRKHPLCKWGYWRHFQNHRWRAVMAEYQ